MKCRFGSKKEKDELRKAVKKEMLDQVEDWQRQYNVDMYSNVLYTVRKETERQGDAWGKERLIRLLKSMCENYDRFRREYDFEDGYAERVKLKEECGLDVEQAMVECGLFSEVKK